MCQAVPGAAVLQRSMSPGGSFPETRLQGSQPHKATGPRDAIQGWANLDALCAPMHVTGQTLLSHYQSQSERHRESPVSAASIIRSKRPWSGCVTLCACCRSIEPKESSRPWSRSIRKRLFKLDTRRPCTILNDTPAHLRPNTTTPSPGPCKTPNKQRQNT